MQNKIEVFILTYNRLQFLRQSLESVLAQTVPAPITVIDNHSDDGTESYMRAAASANLLVEYVRNPSNIGYAGSFAKVLERAKMPYVMLFHDDDILHPEYIGDANLALQKHPGAEMVMSDGSGVPSAAMNAGNWAKPRRAAFLCKDRNAAVAFHYAIGKMMFPTVVYKTENLRGAQFDALNSIGKIYDKVLVCNALKSGPSIVFTDKCYLRYRLHGGQDSNDISTAVSVSNVSNYLSYFRGQMSRTRLGRMLFALKTFKILRSLFKITNMRNKPFPEFARAVDAQIGLPFAAKICLVPVLGGAVYAFERLAAKIYARLFPKTLI